MAKRLELKVFRITKDLTQDEMAEACGVSKSTYCLVEQGKRKGSLDFWNKLQEAFKISDADMWNLMK